MEISAYDFYCGDDLHKECNRFIKEQLSRFRAEYESLIENKKPVIYIQNNRLNSAIIKYASVLGFELSLYNINLNCPNFIINLKVFINYISTIYFIRGKY